MIRYTKNHLLFLYTLLVTLVACSAITPQDNSVGNFNTNLAIGYTTVTQVRATATSLLDAKKITSIDAQNVLQQTDVARAGLDIARSLSGTDMSTANGKLTATTTVLKALATYLASKGGGS